MTDGYAEEKKAPEEGASAAEPTAPDAGVETETKPED